MTTPTNGQGTRFKGWRLAFLLIGTTFCVVALVFGIITTNEQLFAIVSYGIGPLGVILILISWLVPRPSTNEQENLDKPTAHPTPISPSFTLPSTINISSTNPSNVIANQNALPTLGAAASSQSPVIANSPLVNPISSTEANPVVHPSASPDLVFPFNAPLTNPNEFYGRTFARDTLINRTRIGSSTAIVGERYIGKTWLLHYLMLTAPHDTMLGVNYRIGYLDATSSECATVTGFAAKALEALDIVPTTPLREKVDLKTVASAVTKLYKQQMIRPVLCIDGFEGFGQNKEFDLNFLDALRSIASKGLVLIIVTCTPLIDVVVHMQGERARSSSFFNLFYNLTLKPFDIKEAQAFAHDKGKQALFTEQECQHLLERSVTNASNGTKQWYPLKLQLVGHTLLEDKQTGRIDVLPYRPYSSQYWLDFEQRVKEQYERLYPYFT